MNPRQPSSCPTNHEQSVKKILMVKDDQLFLPAILDYLEAIDVEILTTENGVAGLRLVKEFQPDLIVVVVNAPVVTTQNLN